MLASATVIGKGTNLHVMHGDDSGLIVRFYYNKIYEKDFVKLNVPGDSKTEWDYPVKEEDKQRFAQQWAAYQAQQSQLGGQTLLAQWEIMANDEARVKALNSFNVSTVEQLANVADGFIDKLGPGMRELQKKAKAWLSDQREVVASAKFQEELRQRDNTIELLQSQMREMQEQMATLSQPRKPGRPPKAKE